MAGGHLKNVPTHMTYSSAVYRDTVCIDFLMYVLNGLYILAGYIQNAFLETPTEEKYSLILATNVKPIRIELSWSLLSAMD